MDLLDLVDQLVNKALLEHLGYALSVHHHQGTWRLTF
jgi:hypothetical protein